MNKQGHEMHRRKRKTSPRISSVRTVELHQSGNAWKPSRKRNEELDNRDLLKRHIQSVLNKLTFQKFQILLSQLKEADIDTEDNVNVVVGLIFENAIYQPQFSTLYAKTCKNLNSIETALSAGNGVNFSNLVQMKCQQELQTNGFSLIDIEAQLPNSNPCIIFNDFEKRFRLLGTVRFLGELFNLNLIDKSVTHAYLQQFLKNENRFSLECLFILMKVVGKVLDIMETKESPIRPNMIDAYLSRVQNILEEQELSSRSKFQLLDLIDLKKANWVPRRVENVPRTIDEIHMEAGHEALSAQNQNNIVHNQRNISANTTCACIEEQQEVNRPLNDDIIIYRRNQTEEEAAEVDEAIKLLSAFECKRPSMK